LIKILYTLQINFFSSLFPLVVLFLEELYNAARVTPIIIYNNLGHIKRSSGYQREFLVEFIVCCTWLLLAGLIMINYLNGMEDSTVQADESIVTEKTPKEPEFKLATYVHEEYASEEMTKMVRDRAEPPLQYGDAHHVYKISEIMPSWILKSKDWALTKGDSDGSDISAVLKIAVHERSVEQNAKLVQFLMAVWQTGAQMGIKKCTQIMQEFKYVSYEPGDYIIKEGEEGLTFYIIMSGTTMVDKAGIGTVARLGKGKAFGELALVKGDVRTASIIAETKVEVLSLHKLDYDHFIKDIQAAERRENFNLLRDCPLFSAWPRAKVEKLVNTCKRRQVDAGEAVFRQGDIAESLYVIMEGTVQIIKEVTIINKNVWPTSIETWQDLTRKIVKPILTNTLKRKDYFGELAVIRGTPRLDTAKAYTKSLLLQLDKLEFLHLVHHDSAISNNLQQQTQNNRYPRDDYILSLIGHINGGPRSKAQSGQLTIYPNKIIPLQVPPPPNPERPSTLRNKKLKKIAADDRQRRLKHSHTDIDVTNFDEMAKHHDAVGRDNYGEKMASALNADRLLDKLAQGAVDHTHTVEKQALKEMNATEEILRAATYHKKILESPLNSMPIFHKKGKTLNLSQMKSYTKKKLPVVINFEPVKMKDTLKQSLGYHNNEEHNLDIDDEFHYDRITRQPLYASVVKKMNVSPGVKQRKLFGDDTVAKIEVKKKAPKPPQAFV
jgi:CRP-like cAMP-binding protein